MALAAAALSLAAACGSDGGSVNVDTIDISQPSSQGGDPKLAGAAVTQFGNEMFARVRGDTNAVISPVSLAIAFAMLEPGASNEGKVQLDRALHITDTAAYHASMTALRHSLESAKPLPKQENFDEGDLQIAIANATYMQDGYALRPAYLADLGRYYGPVLKSVDFAAHGPDAVDDINHFIADGTRGHITKVLERVDPATVLALVNALYLKASWLEPFEQSKTKSEPFTRRDGSKVTTPLMHGASGASASGDGFVAARKFYSRLAADFVLPDAGRFDDVAAKLSAAFGALEDEPADGSTLVVPKLTTDFHQELRPALEKLGLGALYQAGNLRNVSDDDQLVLDQAIHATFLAMDEHGTEAVAATVLTGTAVSARAHPKPPVPVVLDRPYFFRIVDLETGATLFIGQVLDPTAG